MILAKLLITLALLIDVLTGNPLPSQIQVKVTYYNPALGGLNCGSWDTQRGICTSRTASGELWQNWIDQGGLACPRPYPLWSVWTIEGRDYTCVDRGGWVYVQADGLVRLDILSTHPPHIAGKVFSATVIYGDRNANSKNSKAMVTGVKRNASNHEQ